MMTEPVTKPQTLYEQSIRQALPGPLTLVKEPAWLQSLRHQALSRFETLGLPTRRQETWRYVDLTPVLDLHFDPTSPAEILSQQDIQPYLFSETKNSTLVFVNGRYQSALSQVSGMPHGVIISSLSQVSVEDNARLKSVMAKDIAGESDAFVALNTALFQDAAVIWLPENAVVSEPIHLVFYTKSQNATPQMAYSRLLVVLEKNAELTLVTSFVDDKNQSAVTLNNAVSEFIIGENATFNVTHLQAESKVGRLLAASKITLQKEAKLAMHAFSLGGEFSRHHLQVTLEGEKAHAELNGLSVLNGEQQAYDHTVIDHAVPNCTSEQFYKGILEGHSKSEFDGTIVIRRGAQQSNASQLNKNLLLSDDAKVITRPQLKIDADDVKCSHGATVGQLSEEELFYIRSRGLSHAQARAILTFGFAETVIETVPIFSVRQQMKDLVIKRLSNRKDS